MRTTNQTLIKNPTKMRTGFRYEMRNRAQWPPYGEYLHAEPAEYADGAKIGDCWIVNSLGEKHPHYNVKPLPFHVGNLRNGRRIRRAP